MLCILVFLCPVLYVFVAACSSVPFVRFSVLHSVICRPVIFLVDDSVCGYRRLVFVFYRRRILPSSFVVIHRRCI